MGLREGPVLMSKVLTDVRPHLGRRPRPQCFIMRSRKGWITLGSGSIEAHPLPGPAPWGPLPACLLPALPAWGLQPFLLPLT